MPVSRPGSGFPFAMRCPCRSGRWPTMNLSVSSSFSCCFLIISRSSLLSRDFSSPFLSRLRLLFVFLSSGLLPSAVAIMSSHTFLLRISIPEIFSASCMLSSLSRFHPPWSLVLWTPLVHLAVLSCSSVSRLSCAPSSPTSSSPHSASPSCCP